ncbi:cytochrome P460 family protein [Jannaschia sp. M317]|uniref:cytochrome P460 family protein n=1 Tax=Jannaschia sp. M317 TaxID=2867011 RepID=UPI0021A37FE5|nr:cytochrome P460 family protein [Jannaschia sp. M317]UWQ17596.1 cytochrome P460 family protein [Jannaschia sp. M317]
MRALTLAAAAATALFTLPAAAQEACAVEGDHWDLDDAGVAALYDCMSERMIQGYTKEGDEIAAAYRSWTPTATRMAVAGPHGERFLNTFVNDIAAEQYLKFEDGDFEMPVGSILAKESVAVRKGTGRVGPLFFMTKVDDAPDYDNWFYSGVQPNGKPLKISQAFCHDCHVAFESQDSMGYPLEEVRLSN